MVYLCFFTYEHVFDRVSLRAALLDDAYSHTFRPVSIVLPNGDPPLHVPQVYVHIAYLVSMFPQLSLNVV